MKKSPLFLKKYFSDISVIAKRIDINLTLKLIENINNIKKKMVEYFFLE